MYICVFYNRIIMKMRCKLFLLVGVINSTYSQNANPSNSNCVFPEKLLKECAEVIPEGSSHQLKTSYPWHVGLYRLKPNAQNPVPINVCSGTLISPSVFLTAAHCLAEDADGSLRNISEYSVAAGNDYRQIDDTRDVPHRQVRQIKSVILPPTYRGHLSGFEEDIAVVTLQQPLTLSEVVRPACPAGVTNSNNKPHGQTVGWGLTVDSRHPDTRLSLLNVPYVDLPTCRRQVNPEFHKFLNNNNVFCGEFSKDSSICSTDNGAGLLFSDGGRWYLDGVAGVGLIGGGSCDTRQFNAFISLRPYLPLICQIVQQTP